MALEESKTESRRERFARLNHDCMAIHIWMNFLPEDDDMKLEDLKKMSTADLTALYNEHADKQVKRMESRAKLEERTAQKLREAGKLDEGGEGEVSSPAPAPSKGKGRKSAKPPIEAEPTNSEQQETADMAKNANAKKTPAKKATKTAAKPAAKKEAAGKRGAPLTNHTYVAISEKSKNYNPGGNKLQANSARGIIFAAIQKKEGGLTRQKLEEMFPDQNVKSALDVLSKFGFIQTA